MLWTKSVWTLEVKKICKVRVPVRQIGLTCLAGSESARLSRPARHYKLTTNLCQGSVCSLLQHHRQEFIRPLILLQVIGLHSALSLVLRLLSVFSLQSSHPVNFAHLQKLPSFISPVTMYIFSDKIIRYNAWTHYI